MLPLQTKDAAFLLSKGYYLIIKHVVSSFNIIGAIIKYASLIGCLF